MICIKWKNINSSEVTFIFFTLYTKYVFDWCNKNVAKSQSKLTFLKRQFQRSWKYFSFSGCWAVPPYLLSIWYLRRFSLSGVGISQPIKHHLLLECYKANNNKVLDSSKLFSLYFCRNCSWSAQSKLVDLYQWYLCWYSLIRETLEQLWSLH